MSDFPDLHSPPSRKPMTTGTQKWREAHLYVPSTELMTALEVAIDLGQPLLITGDPGCGKTSAAYWAAWRMGLEPDDLIVEQVRSDASAARMRYEFDAVSYFRESQSSAVRNAPFDDNKRRFIREGALWRAFVATREEHRRVVLLLDEIDKAPRDLPNDLLLEFDEQRFTVPELPSGHDDHTINARNNPGRLALTVLTSNAERQLPDAFLRRCVHHHIPFDDDHLERVVRQRTTTGDLKIPEGFVKLAVNMLVELRQLSLRHSPGPAELLTWLRVLARTKNFPEPTSDHRLDLRKLPYLGTLIKEPADLALVTKQG